MKLLTFLRTSLLLPFCAPIMALPFGLNAVGVILMLSMAFGGVQYAAFAVVMFFLLGRLRTSERMLQICALAPILFLPILIGGWALYASLGGYQLDWGDPILFIVYGLLVGYVYVGICLVAYSLLNSHGWISHESRPGDTVTRAEPDLHA